MRKSNRHAAAALVLSALSALSALASCRSAPLLPSPASEVQDALAVLSLPNMAAFHALIRPGLLPGLSAELLSRLPEGDARDLRRILDSTRSAYLAMSPNGAGGDAAYYALLSGNYRATAMKAALAGTKRASVMPGWILLENGTRLALPSKRHILATNADMASFLERYHSALAGDQDASTHPAAILAGESIVDGDMPGLRLLCAYPAELVLPSFLEGIADIPLSSIILEGRESDGGLGLKAAINFDSENAARIFLPALRILSQALARAYGEAGAETSAEHKGPRATVSGLHIGFGKAADLAMKAARVGVR